MRYFYLFVLSISSSIFVSGQLFTPGYRAVFLTDSSRTYKPGSHVGDKFHFRPLELDLWYPANDADGITIMPYGDFTKLLEQRSNRFQDDTIFHSMSSELVLYICANLGIQDTAALTNLRTDSYKNAAAINRKFPLIIYMCAFNGMSYENIALFELLASHGYIVACITSVGRYPGNMSTKVLDITEQVTDGLFALNYLKTRNTIDSSKIGIVGYSWGGLTACAVAIQRNDVKAVLSLDGSEMHYYGSSAEEDSDFNEWRSGLPLQTKNISVPYTYLESGHKQEEDQADSIFNILRYVQTSKQYFRFPQATHEDFSMLPSLPARLKRTFTDSNNLYQQFCFFTLRFFDKYLEDKSAPLNGQELFLTNRRIADTSFPVALGNQNITLITLKGVVKDSQTSNPLPFTNVGIPGKNIGTVTAEDGSFHLKLKPDQLTDSLKFSMVGYRESTYSIAASLKKKLPIIYSLVPKVTTLKAVVVTARTSPVKIIGNISTSKSMSFGFPLKFLGSEIGIRMHLGKKNVLLKTFHFNVADNRLDTGVFRLNIYTILNGIPGENILRQNILVKVGDHTGIYSIELSPYKLIMHGDVFVSLEWIQGSSRQKNGAIFFAAGLLKGATWHRPTSQGAWKKFPAIGVGFNMAVQALSDGL